MTDTLLRDEQIAASPIQPEHATGALTDRPSGWLRRTTLRLIIAAAVIVGANYIIWRWLETLNLARWWIAIPLVAAETYSFIDSCLFGMAAWRTRQRGAAPPPPVQATVDVFVTTYNESVELVERTAIAARSIEWQHQTYVLDDGDRPEMRAMAERLGIGYILRSAAWEQRPRHAKAGNLNNALMTTSGEFVLVLDADQVPYPEILHRTLGWFTDPDVAFVQTPQWFANVPDSDPLGSQAPLFYGPIQQGKDGWNSAFFCGSNAVVRREALMQIGIDEYVRTVDNDLGIALDRVSQSMRKGERRALAAHQAILADAARTLGDAATIARIELDEGEPFGEVTYRFQRCVDRVAIQIAKEAPDVSDAGAALIEQGRTLVSSIDVDRDDEAQPLMPLATISVTEDMATAMRLHAGGWRSVYHHELLAEGLAPEDLGTMLQQRLRWAQGTLQLLLRDNPLTKTGLTIGQRLMYFATMWSYLSGFAALVYIVAPIVYLTLGVRPVLTYGTTFFWHVVPYLLLNQLLFLVVGRGSASWRGQQYSLALFPTWIRASVTAAANVWFNRDLGFVVTPKTRQDRRGTWRLVWVQLASAALLVLAIVIGLIRLAAGVAPTTIGTYINIVWALYELAILSVIVSALRYRGSETSSQVEA